VEFPLNWFKIRSLFNSGLNLYYAAHNSSSGPITGRYIVGGMPALKNEIPYQVAIYVKGRMECGGSILDEWFIVTAAHCIFPGIEYSAYSVYAGEHSLISHTDDGTEQTRAVHNIFVHEEYNKGRGTLTNDIAIIQLKARLELNKEVARISLPTAGHVPGGMVQTSGWGRLTQGGSTPNVLYKVSLPIIEDAECEGWYNANTYKMDGQIMICVSWLLLPQHCLIVRPT